MSECNGGAGSFFLGGHFAQTDRRGEKNPSEANRPDEPDADLRRGS